MYIYTICSTLNFKNMKTIKVIDSKGNVYDSIRCLCREKNVAKTTVLRYLDKFGEFKSNWTGLNILHALSSENFSQK